MKIGRRGRSDDVIDRRGASPGRSGGLGGLPISIGAGGGIGTLIILALVLFGGNLFGGGGGGGFGSALDQIGTGQVPAGEATIPPEADPERDDVEFVSFVLDDVQNTWTDYFAQNDQQYDRAKLVLYRGLTSTGCGTGQAAMGPFYCPADQQVYLDLDFFDELTSRFGAPGDFAQAYVIAHEVAHHVQNLTGISNAVRQEQQKNPNEANELSVKLELQADCLAGVWGYTAKQRGILEPGDLQEGLDAAAAVGDDRIQKEATGQVNPDTWTHGSSEQRMEWFSRGFDSGDPGQCNTFD